MLVTALDNVSSLKGEGVVFGGCQCKPRVCATRPICFQQSLLIPALQITISNPFRLKVKHHKYDQNSIQDWPTLSAPMVKVVFRLHEDLYSSATPIWWTLKIGFVSLQTYNLRIISK